MAYEAEQDPYCYRGTSVLINLADIREQAELDEFELSMFLSRAEEPLPGGSLDYPHYLAIHRHLFQDVYAWAGEPRTIRIAKGGNWFCYPENLPSFMTATFAAFARQNYLTELPLQAFAAQAAAVLAEINAGHAFREGNGRTQMAFLKVVALNAGYHFDDEAIGPAETLDAMIQSFDGNLERLASMIARVVG